MAENKNDSSNDMMLFMVIALVLVAGIAKYSDKIEAWFWNHISFIILCGVGFIYGIVKLMKWRFKMKHPEVYERELALKQMNHRDRDPRNF
jgi:uncharacterized membrane protein